MRPIPFDIAHRPRRAGRASAPIAALCALSLATPAAAADAVERGVLDAFNTLVREVSPIAEQDPDRAIERYEQALLDGPTRGFGRLHLRIAQLHRTVGRNAEAAHHFQACTADERVDPIDRRFICERGYDQVTAPFTVGGLPDGARVMIIEPTLAAGLHQNGARVPRGEVTVVVEAPGRVPERSKVPIDGPTLWTAQVGLERPEGPLVPEGFVAEAPVEPIDPGLPRWPAYAAGGAGLALVAGGLAIGFGNRGALDDVRAQQRAGDCGPDICRGDLDAAEGRALLADGLWIGGAVLVAGGLAWWLLTGEAPVAEAAR